MIRFLTAALLAVSLTGAAVAEDDEFLWLEEGRRASRRWGLGACPE